MSAIFLTSWHGTPSATKHQRFKLLLIWTYLFQMLLADTILSKSPQSRSIHRKRILQTCTPSCTACDSNQLCTSCATGYILSPASTCETLCRQREYLLGGTGTCQQCDNQCKNCWGTSTNCTECYYGLKPFQHQADPPLFKCVPTCASNEWYSLTENSCVQCPYLCLTCVSTTGCLSCKSGSLLQNGKCLINCPEGHYRDLNNRCLPCDAWCKTCFQSSNNCTSCTSTDTNVSPAPNCRFTNGNCDPGFFSQSVCQICTGYPVCLNCDNTNKCTKCQNRAVLDSNGKLVTLSSYLTTNHDCMLAMNNCLVISQDGINCIECAPGYSGSPCNVVDLNCPVGEYESGNHDLCIPCSENCLECDKDYGTPTDRFKSSSFPCRDCKDDYMGLNPCRFVTTECLINEYWLTGNPTVCSHCSPTCRTCFNSANNCTSCFPGFYLVGSTCKSGASSSTCPAGQVLYEGSCRNCPTLCQLCLPGTPPTVCLACVSGTPMDPATGICTPACSPTCLSCGPLSVCTTCRNSATMTMVGTTHCICNGGYRMDSSYNCQPCAQGCSTCPTAPNVCTGCISGYTLTGQSCQLDCASGYYPVSLLACSTCDQRCTECLDGTNTQCSACKSGFDLDNGRCVCPPGKSQVYAVTWSCIQCDPSCLSCTVEGIQGCSTCTPPMTLYQGANPSRCVNSACTSQQYFSTVTFTCQPCHATCQACTDGTASNCSACFNGNTLVGSICYSSVCSTGQYFDPNSPSACQTCPSGCTACAYTSQVECSQCASTHYLSNKNCFPCDSSCLTCSGSSSQSCLSCRKGLNFDSNQCLQILSCAQNELLDGVNCLSKSVSIATFDISQETLTWSLGMKTSADISTSWIQDVLVSVKQSNGEPFQFFKIVTTSSQSTSGNVIVSLNFESDITNGFITIEHRDKQKVLFKNNSTYVDPGAVVKTASFTILKSAAGATVGAAATALSNSVGPAQTTAMIVATPLSASAGTLLQKLMNFFEFLVYLNGRRLTYPDKILKGLSIQLLPLDYDNYLEVDEQEVNCTPSPNYADNDVSCNILNNFGKDILFMGFVLLITLFILLLKRVVTVVIKNPNNLFRRFVVLLHDKFGPMYFVITFEGSSNDVICFSVLNIYFYNSNTPQHIGLAVGGAFLLCIFAVSILSFKFIKEFVLSSLPEINAYTRTKRLLDSQAEEAKLSGNFSQDLKQIHETRLHRCLQRIEDKKPVCSYGVFSFLVESYKPNLSPYYYMLPVVTFGKNLLSQLLLVLLAYQDMYQVLAILLVQAVYTVYITMARPKLDSLENWVNIISGVLFTVYILLVWIVNQGIEERVAQELYGLIMAVILVTIVCVNMVLILYTILKALFLLFKDLWDYVGKRAPKKEVPEFEEDLPNDDDMTANLAKYSIFISNSVLSPDKIQEPSKLDESVQVDSKCVGIKTSVNEINPDQHLLSVKPISVKKKILAGGGRIHHLSRVKNQRHVEPIDQGNTSYSQDLMSEGGTTAGASPVGLKFHWHKSVPKYKLKMSQKFRDSSLSSQDGNQPQVADEPKVKFEELSYPKTRLAISASSGTPRPRKVFRRG